MKRPDGNRHKILSVGNDPETLTSIRRILAECGHDVSECFSVEKAIGTLEFDRVDMIICEMEMPVVSGLDLLRYVKENLPGVEMMLYGRQNVETAVAAIKAGAEDYLTRPFNTGELAAAVRKMAEKISRRRTTLSGLSAPLSHGIIGGCAAMQAVARMIEKAAATLVNVLIVGESGTGKELMARAVHYTSDRSRAPFVPVNCTAIPDSLIESELFGHVRDAAAGPGEARAGFYQIADGGTLFLDEIGDASLKMQGQLLRVLRSREIRLKNSGRVRKVDTRIIAATHMDLSAMVARGLFREDLFYRLNVINMAVPPLRERKDDILFLIHHFNERFSKEADRPPPAFSEKTLQVMKSYHWPGNVRELENLIQRLVVLVDGPMVRMVDMPPHMRCQIPRRTEGLQTLGQVEVAHIREVLQAVSGNKTRAAEVLGIDRKTLRTKLRQWEAIGT